MVINVPIAKNHGSATLTLGMKNLMGVMLGPQRPALASGCISRSPTSTRSVARS